MQSLFSLQTAVYFHAKVIHYVQEAEVQDFLNRYFSKSISLDIRWSCESHWRVL